MTDYRKIRDIAVNLNCKVLEQEPLSKHTTFKIGGNARLFIYVNNVEALKDILCVCRKEATKPFILGKGSNTLFYDDDFDGVVLTLDGDFKKMYIEDESCIVCGSGASLAALCAFAMENSLSGLETAWGIPASVGGAAFMNAGAYGGEMKDVIKEVYALNERAEAVTFSLSECDYGYRHSIFMYEKYIITGIKVCLKKGNKQEIKQKMDDYMQRRKSKQPLEYPSAGSVFKRPVGHFAGALIEQSNLKGYEIGGAQVSTKHAGFIINKGNASCSDVLSLVKHIQEVVYKNSGVNLECEIRPIGRSDNYE